MVTTSAIACSRVGAQLRDTVRSGDLICRLGGEEFVAVMPGADAAEAARIAERARRTTESREFQVDSAAASVSITVSIVSPNGGRTGITPSFIVERTGRFTDRSRRAAIAFTQDAA
jgi:diguanylate cyclase (GGDEF)-like protein